MSREGDEPSARPLGTTRVLDPRLKPGASTAFRSLLFDDSGINPDIDKQDVPEFFSDLNLDQVVASITAGRDEYNLKPFFYTPLKSVAAINYRYDIFRDLDSEVLLGHVQAYAQDMRTMRSYLIQSDKLYYKYQKQRWFLDAVDVYCGTLKGLNSALATADLISSGFRAFRDFLTSYSDSDEFVALVAETQQLKTALSGIKYSLHLEGRRIKVGRYDASEPDYGADVLLTFEKFKQGAPKEYRFRYSSTPEMNHVEAAILDLVAQLHPDIFARLDKYCNRYSVYLSDRIARFDREVQFYVACREYVEQFRGAELPFCYPTVTDRSKEVLGCDVFDVALANRLVQEGKPVVMNDFSLKTPEHIVIVSGPNQGGKTTFARTFGQLHYLASIGCLVPGREARLFLFDRLFTHFEREEDLRNLSGKLEDELRRIHRIFEQATPNSILIMNESFLSTTLNDALFLSKQILQRILDLNLLCVSVTFLDELSSISEATVSMVSTVDPKDPALRTFKIIRKPANGLAYAVALAEKYHLTYEMVKGRIAEEVKGPIRA